VLYDLPGPTAERRHRLYGFATVGVLGALTAWVLFILASKGQFESNKWDFLAEPGTYRAIGAGLLNTVKVAVVAIALALVFGAVFAVARLSDRPWVRWPATAVIEFFRAIPLLLLILFIFLGYGDVLGRFWALVLGLMLYNGAVLAEIFRAGISAVPRGQREAANALGMSKTQVMTYVLVPQAVRIMLPAIISQSVVALKDTALGFVIAYTELARTARDIFVSYNNPLQAGIVITAIFIALNYALSRLAVYVEARQRRAPRAAGERPSTTTIESGVGQAPPPSP
jgi:glutamate transport system permease protein